MYKKIKIMMLISLCMFFVNSCYKDKGDKLYPAGNGNNCDTSNMKYSANVSPILTSNCAISGCHTTANKSNVAGYAYDSYSETLNSVSNGKLLKSIKHEAGTSQMPKASSKMNDCNINIIESWIRRGALNN